MKEKPCLGISLFIKSSFAQLTQSVVPLIAEFMQKSASIQVYANAKPLQDLEELKKIPAYAVESWKQGVVLAHAKDELMHYAQLLQPAQVFGPIPQHIGILLDPAHFDNAEFLSLCKALKPLYGYVMLHASCEDAYDEVFWPTQTLAPNPQQRMHSQAWIRLMRSFARNDIDSSLPDIYWANIFGPRIINEIRKKDAWNALESLKVSEYIDNTFLYLKLSAFPQMHQSPDFVALQQKLGDILCPLACIQKPLLQTRHGNALLLQDLAQTRDPRLLLGLATAEALPTFVALLPEEVAAEIDSVSDALAYLQRTQGQRPRCYGESLPSEEVSDEAKNDETPQTEQVLADNTEPQPAPPLPNAFNWNLRTLAHTALRLDLATLQLTLDHKKDRQTLELGLSNVLPRAIVLDALYAVRTKEELPTLLVSHDKLNQRLLPNDKAFHISLDLPFPETGEELHIYAPVQYVIDEPIVDIIHNGKTLNVLGAVSSRAHSLSTWPVAARVHIEGSTILIAITNTTQETWSSWQLSLILAGNTQKPFAHFYNNTVLNAGESAFAQLDAGFAQEAKALQIQLRASASSCAQLAVFEAS